MEAKSVEPGAEEAGKLEPSGVQAAPDAKETKGVGEEGKTAKPAASWASVEVTDPMKKSEGLGYTGTYTVYKVSSTANDGGKTVQVLRRYSDFLWLRKELEAGFPGCLVPPIPEKSVLGRFHGEFVNQRMRGLEKFLRRVVEHAKLKDDPLVEIFLRRPDDNFNEMKAKSKTYTAASKAKSTFSLISGFGSAMLTPFVAAKVQREETEDDAACEEIVNYSANLHKILSNLHTSSTELMKKDKDSSKAWFQFGESLVAFGQCEMDNKGTLGETLAKIGKCCDRMSVSGTQDVDKSIINLVEPLKEYIFVVEALQQMMTNRRKALETHEDALGVFQKRKQALESIRGKEKQGSTAVKAAEEAESEAKAQVEKTKKKLEDITKSVFSEVVRFKQEKNNDFKRILEKFVVMQVEQAKLKHEVWSSLLTQINTIE